MFSEGMERDQWHKWVIRVFKIDYKTANGKLKISIEYFSWKYIFCIIALFRCFQWL